MEMGYFAGLDIGGTTGRIRLADGEGNLIGEYSCGGCSIHSGRAEWAREQYRQLVLPVLEKNGLSPEKCLGLCAAASGIDSENLRCRCRSFFEEMGFEKERIRIYNDCEIFLQAYEAPAMILVAGTGSIVFGISRNGEIVRTGGWGHILSDEGSGFYLGMQVIKAVGDHLDGRHSDPLLYRVFYEKTGIADLEKLSDLVNDNILTKQAVAELAPLVSAAAAKGSDTAAEISRDAARKLSLLIRDNCRKMTADRERPMTVIFWGSVLLKNEDIRRMVTEQIKEFIPEVQIRIPEKTAAEIALETAWRHYGEGGIPDFAIFLQGNVVK